MPNLTITLAPSGVNSIGAHWKLDGVAYDGIWYDSGASATLGAGLYTVVCKPVEGYQTPANLDVTIVASNVTATITYGSDAWASTWNPPISTCLFRGQVIMAGAKYKSPGTVKDHRLVRWSEIGAFRFLGATAQSMRNEAGELYIGTNPMDMALCVKPMKNGVIVYGAYSTTVLVPVSQPAPTFGIDRVLPIGIANPLAVAGDDTKHMLVDRDGVLWGIGLGANGALVEKSLGYSHIFRPMQDDLDIATGKGVIVVTHNPDEDEFYISDGLSSYMFNEFGLTRIDRAITSYVNLGRAHISSDWSDALTEQPLCIANYTEDSDFGYVETDIIDFNMSAIKTINSVEVAGALGDLGEAYVMVKWRNSSAGAFRNTSWVRCSPQGVARPSVSGRDFKLCYKSTKWSGLQIQGITVEWQLSDKTNIRGQYTNVSSLTSKPS